mmetsp:Transcript_31107/g.71191  ORF Transcript_31107/g.71191 Transcript_31107/m.71191 type:complete len:211 (-) Transcript_31107:22-654(-)
MQSSLPQNSCKFALMRTSWVSLHGPCIPSVRVSRSCFITRGFIRQSLVASLKRLRYLESSSQRLIEALLPFCSLKRSCIGVKCPSQRSWMKRRSLDSLLRLSLIDACSRRVYFRLMYIRSDLASSMALWMRPLMACTNLSSFSRTPRNSVCTSMLPRSRSIAANENVSGWRASKSVRQMIAFTTSGAPCLEMAVCVEVSIRSASSIRIIS